MAESEIHDPLLQQLRDERLLTPQQVEHVYRDIEQKRSTTRYLHTTSLLAEPVPQIHAPSKDRA